MAHAEQLKRMESQLDKLAQEAVESAEGGGNDAENPAIDIAEVLHAQDEVRIVERELEEFAAAHNGEVTTTTDDLKKDLQYRLEVAESDDQRQKIMDQYDAERCELLTKLDEKQTEHRTRLQAKLQAKKKAVAFAEAMQSTKAYAVIAENGGAAVAENDRSRAEASLGDPDYKEVAKSIVADYTSQVVRVFLSFRSLSTTIEGHCVRVRRTCLY
eukprot:COSAG02_NODE_3099_length_7378_cov_3.046984_5_plen_214_part_00